MSRDNSFLASNAPLDCCLFTRYVQAVLSTSARKECAEKWSMPGVHVYLQSIKTAAEALPSQASLSSSAVLFGLLNETRKKRYPTGSFGEQARGCEVKGRMGCEP